MELCILHNITKRQKQDRLHRSIILDHPAVQSDRLGHED